jgi:hypothetical protein
MTPMDLACVEGLQAPPDAPSAGGDIMMMSPKAAPLDGHPAGNDVMMMPGGQGRKRSWDEVSSVSSSSSLSMDETGACLSGDEGHPDHHGVVTSADGGSVGLLNSALESSPEDEGDSLPAPKRQCVEAG